MKTTHTIPVSATSREGRVLRLVLWGGVVALVGLSMVGVGIDQGSLRRTIAASAGGLTAALILFAFYVANRIGINRYHASLKIELGSDRISSHHPDRLSTVIMLTEIAAIQENPRGLLIYGAVPAEAISVPSQISAYADVRETLRQIREFTPAGRFPWGILVPCILIPGWVVLFLSTLRHVIVIVAVIVVMLHSWETIVFARNLKRYRWRKLLWISLLLMWLAAMWLIYRRLTSVGAWFA